MSADPTLIADYERKLAEALENGGYAHFDSWKDYQSWSQWCVEQGHTVPLARSPQEATEQGWRRA